MDNQKTDQSTQSDMYSGNGGYTLNEMYLLLNEGEDKEERVDISEAFFDCSLYESINSPCMTGNVSIVDSWNLKDTLPLYGKEKFFISFHTAGISQETIDFTGIIYKISDNERLTDHTSGYILFFMSEFMYYSIRTQMQRVYAATSSDIVVDIFNNSPVSNHKPLQATNSVGIRKYAFGTTKPLEAISCVSKGATSEQNDSGYLFYENNKEYCFVPIQELYRQESTNEYIYRNAGMYEDLSQRHIERFSAIQDINIIEDNDLLARIIDGQHGSTWTYLDLLTKETSTYTYSRSSNFDKTKSLGEIPDKKEIDNPTGNDISFFGVYGDSNNIIFDKYHLSTMAKHQLESIKLQIVVFGDSSVKCGTVCTAHIPDWQIKQGLESKMIRGRFLISNIKHTFTKEQYKQTLELCKDAYEQI